MTVSFKHIVGICLMFCAVAIVHGQNQTIADSLTSVYKNLGESDTARFRILTLIANNQNDPRLKLEYADLLLAEANKVKSNRYLHHAYLNQGQAYRLTGDFDIAIYSLFKALNYAEKVQYRRGIAAANTALADVYSLLGNHTNSIIYYQKAMDWLTEDDLALRANILLNMGDEYYVSGVYDSALVAFEESRRIYQQLGNDPSGLAYNLGNIGLVQAELGNLQKAESYIREAIHELEKLGDHYGSAIFLSYMAEIYQKDGLLRTAKMFADSSMRISQRYGLKAEIRDNSLRLADIYAMSSDYEKAYKYHQQYVAIKDSISNDEIYTQIENLESAFELAKKQAEVDILTVQQKNQRIIIITAIIIALILTVLAVVIFFYYKSKARVNAVLESQKRSLEALNQTKDKFFSIISHDLRGPINSFHGVSNLIKYFVESKNPEELLEVADDIDRSVDRLSNLLDNLLTWAMQQQGHFPNVPEKLNLNEMARELVETLDNMAKGKQIELDARIDDEILLWADRNTTMTILRNLVNNGLKFTEPGGKVGLTAVQDGDYAMIKIFDTGVGMPKDKLKKLWRLQEQRSSYGTAGERGLGLGLQLVYEFVEANQGKVEVESAEDIGTTFTVWLPLFESIKTETAR